MTTTQCPQCLAILPPHAKLCLRCGNPAPPAPVADPIAPAPPDEIEPSADVAEAPLTARAISVAAALGAIALFIVLVYASC